MQSVGLSGRPTVARAARCVSRHQPRPLASLLAPNNRINLPKMSMCKASGKDVVSSSGVCHLEPKIKVGDKIPMDKKVFVFEGDAENPKEISIGDVIGGKKAVVFGLPGAFTSVCSSKHVPEYMEKRDMLFEQGVEVIACVSVNDAYVMKHWAKDLGVDTNIVHMLADGDGSFHEALGLTQIIPGLGCRARRYSMYLEDGVVKVLNIDEPGGMSYKVSGPSHMTECLKQLKK